MQNQPSNSLEEDVLASLTRSEKLRSRVGAQAEHLAESALQVQHGANTFPVHQVAGQLYERAQNVSRDLGAL